MSTLTEKILKNSTIDKVSTLSHSDMFSDRDVIPTSVPMLNVALSGSLEGGLTTGITMFAGPSKHFKTAFALLMGSSYLNKYKDGVILFYDSEFGSGPSYFETFDIDTNKVIHTPIKDIEELKFDLSKQLSNLQRGERVIIIIDSLGNLASKKEVEDSMEQKSVADMSRAKAIKSLFRVVTPYLIEKDIPMIIINHTYKEIGMYPKDIVGGGTGPYYSADNIWIIGRQQEKTDGDVTGYNFIINIEKSRMVREKSKIPITVTFDEGIFKWSGFVELALESGWLVKPAKGWYSRHDKKTGETFDKKYRYDEIVNNNEFWEDFLKTTDFKDWIEHKFSLGKKK